MSIWCPSMGANLPLAAKLGWGVHFTGRAAGIVFFRISGLVDAGYTAPTYRHYQSIQVHSVSHTACSDR